MYQARALAIALLAAMGAGAARAPAQTDAGPATATSQPSAPKLSAGELEQLVAPIALYPDVLLAQLLPAATFPTDVVMAARWLRVKPDLGKLDQKPWDDSVKALCHYPDVLNKLDEDLEWTNALGAAFLAQPEDVMKAIQTGRELAQSRDLLKTTPQQTVVVEEETIRIVPTEPDVVYVPQYNPQIIYVDDDDHHYDEYWAGAASAAIGFGAGLALGAWLDMDCHWYGGYVGYTQPGYYAGWAHSGAVAWGPRGAAVVGPERGFVAGQRGGVAWGPNGAAAWRRPPVASPLPAYTGRYASYGAGGGTYSGARNVSNNINVNRNNTSANRSNVSFDRGDRTSIGGGSRTSIGGGDRTSIGGGNRTNISGGNRTGLGASATPYRSPSASAFNSTARSPQASQFSQRGQQSLNTARPSATPRRAASPSPQARSAPRSSPPQSSAFRSNQSARQTASYSSRGAASRGGRGGGGGGRR